MCHLVVSPSLAYAAALCAERGSARQSLQQPCSSFALQLAVRPEAYTAARSHLADAAGYADSAHVPPATVHWDLDLALAGNTSSEQADAPAAEVATADGGDHAFTLAHACVTVLWLEAG